MKVVYIANTCEHVVRPLCDGLYSEYGEDFIFIETMELDKNRAGIVISLTGTSLSLPNN